MSKKKKIRDLEKQVSDLEDVIWNALGVLFDGLELKMTRITDQKRVD